MIQRFCNRVAGGIFWISVLILFQNRFYQLRNHQGFLFKTNFKNWCFNREKGKHATLILYTLHVRIRLLPNQHGFRPPMEQHPPNDGHETVRLRGGPSWDANAMAAPPERRSVVWPRSPGSEMNSSCGEGFVTLSLFGYVPKLQMIHKVSPNYFLRWIHLSFQGGLNCSHFWG